ncbi:unnamed protein product [Prunus armeniaca]
MDSIKIPTHVEEAFNDPKWAEDEHCQSFVVLSSKLGLDPEAIRSMKKFGCQQANTDHTLFIKHRAGKKYVMDLLADTGMLNCKLADTPIVENHKLGVYVDQVPTNKERYQRLVERLIYLSLTRPDIAYAVKVASQFMHSPSENHMAAVIRIPSYSKSTHGRGLLFKKNGHLDLEGYTDSDYAGNIINRCFASGYFTFVGGNLIMWRSKKQNIVTRSSAESEYRGIAQRVCEILWLRWLLAEIGFRPDAAAKLHCDSQSAFEIANNPAQHDRTKHVEVDLHFIKKKLEQKLISILLVPSSEQLVDMWTHVVSKHRFEDSLDKLDIIDCLGLKITRQPN